MITFSCECGKRFQVKDELAGKRAKCSCGKTLVIPKLAAVTQVSAPPSTGLRATKPFRPETKPNEPTSHDAANAAAPSASPATPPPSIVFLKSLGAFGIAALALMFTRIVPANALGGMSNAFGYIAAVVACLGGTALLRRAADRELPELLFVKTLKAVRLL